MTEPIEVTIRNNTNGSLHISWLRGRSYIVSEGKALRVNYEPWSCPGQRLSGLHHAPAYG